jgi:hypothetical protein
LRFAFNDGGASLRGIKKKNLATLCGCVRELEQAKNIATAVRGQENTVDHCNQVRRGKEEKR